MEKPPRPWYREFWPWFLMLFPATAVVAGFITFRIAAQSDDGVVEDDYYKQGLAINRVLARGQVAAAAGLSGVARFSGETVTLRLSGHPDAWPEQLVLRVLHPTRAGRDQTVTLVSQGGGLYQGACRGLAGGKWKLVLEDAGRHWRLSGEIGPGEATAQLAPVQ